jgi:hypothetical protein
MHLPNTLISACLLPRKVIKIPTSHYNNLEHYFEAFEEARRIQKTI